MKRKIYILDTTLRDGDQSPGYSLSVDEKIRIAGHLEKLGVDIIEAGFPASSRGQFSAVQRVAESLRTSAVSAMARARPEDIKQAGDAIRNAEIRYIHTSIATSPVHRRVKLRKSRSEILRIAADAVRLAAEYADFVEIGAEDATRTEPEFLAEFCDAVTAAGADIVNIADTVGYIQPQEFSELVKMLCTSVRAFRNGTARISVHCHNDLGLAVANTLAGLNAGAGQAEVTLLGIGERGGNTPLEEIAAALTARHEYYSGLSLSVNMEGFADAVKELNMFTGIAVPPNKPVAGRNAFAHTSGIHQNGMLLSSATYSVLSPDRFGLPPHRLVISRHSGVSGLNAVVRELTGSSHYNADYTGLMDEFKEIADGERHVSVTRLLTLLYEDGVINNDLWYLDSCRYAMSGSGQKKFSVSVNIISIRGKKRKTVARGETISDAVISALKSLFKISLEITGYSFSGTGNATSASVSFHVSAEYEGRAYADESYGDDMLTLFVTSYLNIINRVVVKFQLTGI